MANHPLPKSLLDEVAQRFKVLAEPLRLEILNLLMTHEELNVMRLVELTGQRQANISKHLTLMAREGILQRRKDGLNVYYKIADPTIEDICSLVCDRLREEHKMRERLFKEFQDEE
ncbi:MAG: ArsR family transcriptional regulator [Calditrichaeota bacterium]|nr:MAG: ArsR family transcriptional regulator [Calditrichota bacterium]